MNPQDAIIETNALNKQFVKGGYALKQVQFCMRTGSFLGLVGPDGAGKTTLLRILAGLMQPTEGTVRVLGKDPYSTDVRKDIGYMPQKFGLYEDLTVIENLSLNAELRGISGQERLDMFQKLLEFTDLERFRKRRSGALSGGMKQKLGLACALLAKPKVLLLDEPGVGVDPIARRDLWRMVQELVEDGMSVVWSTAYLDEAERCADVILLNDGEILFKGKPSSLTQRLDSRAIKIRRKNGSGKRKLLTRLLDRPEVSDGVIEGDDVRIILREKNDIISIQSELPQETSVIHVEPRFEDAFVDLLGGGPGGTSVAAEHMTPKYSNSSVVIEAIQLTKQYGDFYATKDVNFKVHHGEIFGLLGSNGAGKSTTFKMMCGLSVPTSGEALVSGISLKNSGSEARKKIGYMAQKFSLYGNLSVADNLSFFSGAYGLKGKDKRERIQLMTDIFGFGHHLKNSPDSLPLGYKQRLALACAIMHEPDILFLDEPTSGVDPVTRREFWTHIYGLTAKGVTVMVTTHFMDEAEYCDRIAMMDRGQIISLGSPDNLKKSLSEDGKMITMEDAFIKLLYKQKEVNCA
jgi:ABC-2 type transport system ATP-binding protein